MYFIELIIRFFNLQSIASLNLAYHLKLYEFYT